MNTPKFVLDPALLSFQNRILQRSSVPEKLSMILFASKFSKIS
jgi:hypothetical protein